MKNNKMQAAIIAGLGVLVFAVVFAGILLTRNAKKTPKTINTESAVATLERYEKRIAPSVAEVVKSPVELTDVTVDELPDIDTNEITVGPNSGLYAEIFATAEKCGRGKGGWRNEGA